MTTVSQGRCRVGHAPTWFPQDSAGEGMASCFSLVLSAWDLFLGNTHVQ